MYRGMGEPIIAAAQRPNLETGGLNCPSWAHSFYGSACWQRENPGVDPSLLCMLGISCVTENPNYVLRSAGSPPPVDGNGLAPADYSVDDVASAGAAQNAGVLARWWASLRTPEPEAPPTDFLPVVLAVGAVALFSVMRH